MVDHYETLEVPKTASQDDIKKAYRKKAKKNHPDQGGDKDEFKQIAHAYEVLADPSRRQRYDETGDDQKAGLSEAMNLVKQAIEAVLFKEDRSDMIQHAKDVIRSNIDGIKSTIRQTNQGLSKLRKRRARLTHNETLYDKDTFELVSGIVDHHIKKHEQIIHDNEQALNIIDEAIALLDGITCEDRDEGSSLTSKIIFRAMERREDKFTSSGGMFYGGW